jgi:hypothetical protein
MGRMKPRSVLALLVAAVLAAAAAQPAAAQTSTPFFSVNVGSLFNPDGTLRADGEAQLRALQATGLTAARMDASRAVVEPFPGMRDFSVLDRIATALASHGLVWLPTLGYAPLWERSIAGTDKTPPASDAAFASYAAAVAARYGPGGRSGAPTPSCPRSPSHRSRSGTSPTCRPTGAPDPTPRATRASTSPRATPCTPPRRACRSSPAA